MTKPKTGTVYTLTDPRDGTIRYVGKTMKSLPERLAGHLASPTNPAMRLWISTLGTQKLIPAITLVSTAAEAQLGAEEERLIRKHIDDGHRLLNSPYYHQHITDLTEAVPSATRSVKAALAARTRRERLRAFATQQYKPIADARAAGKVSRRRAAVQVALRAVLVALHTLWLLPGVRYLGYGGVLLWYLSTIGLEPLVQQCILPRLPVAEIMAFWTEYLAQPCATLAVHGAVLLYVVSFAGYMELRIPTDAHRNRRI